jgi:GNAT superfamily N-acetyltransferase
LSALLHITHELARRLEAAEARDGADCADAYSKLHPGGGACVKAAGGGFLMFTGAGSPLTHAVGIGMHGPVTGAELDEIEEYYRSRGSATIIDVCPYADRSLLELLSGRGYRVAEFANVMVMPIDPGHPVPTPPSNIMVRRAELNEAELYSHTTVKGFFGREEVTDEEIDIGSVLFTMQRAEGWLAFVDAQCAGAGGLSIRNGVASCFGDGTLATWRGRGVQSALIATRVRAAQEAGCTLITAGTEPGSTSQRNYERLGFRVAYTKAAMLNQ